MSHTSKKISFLATLVLFTFLINAQNTSWISKNEKTKAFIENKGQFIMPVNSENVSPILFAVDHGTTRIYFTNKGLTYSFLEVTPKVKDEKELERERTHAYRSAEEYKEFEKEEHAVKIKTDVVTMLFANASNNVEIIPSAETRDYHNYEVKENGEHKSLNYIKGFEKLTYKNIYPNIDIEYEFAKEGGLKYTLILHPHANPLLVQMVYDKHISIINNEVHIKTKFGNIIDHAPISFYQSEKHNTIQSQFVKTGKSISIQLANYDNTKTIIIDPWTTMPAYTNNWDCVWECEHDGAGNVYTIGGTMPMELKKYSPTGTVLWSYNTPYDTTSWLGGFSVDNIGNAYVTNGSTARLLKVNNAGVLQYSINGGSFDEYWEIAFNCDQSKLIVAGSRIGFGLGVVPEGYIFDINPSSGSVLASQVVGSGGSITSAQEVRSICSANNGRYYYLTLDTIGAMTQNFNSCGSSNNVFKTNSTHNFGYKAENYRYNNTGIMAIKADANFVYTHNGTTLFKRSLANGAILSSVAIPGGAATTSLGRKLVSCSGIDIDATGNIYVGSTNAVTKFSPALTQIATASVAFNVYDVHVNTNGEIIACGSTGNSGTASRTGYIQSISTLAAGNTMSIVCCDANICPVPNQCITGSPVTLQVSTTGGTWSGTGVNASGVFNPATAGTGTHVVTYSLACGSGSVSIIVNPCTSFSVCNSSGTFSITGGTPSFTWSSYNSGGSTPITNQTQCQACGYTWNNFISTCLNGGIPATSCTQPAGYVQFAVANATTLPTGSTNIQIVDAGGTTYTFVPSSVPSCNNTCPTLTLAVSSQSNVNCYGNNTGGATIVTTGGTGAYTYTWLPGNLSGVTQNALSAGVYTVNVKDANNCPGNTLLTITQPTAPLALSLVGATPAACGSANGSATITATGGTPSYNYTWVPSGGNGTSASALNVGTYSVGVIDSKGCFTITTVNINSANGPTLSVVSQQSVNCFGANTGSATINATGGSGPYNYTWTPGNLIGASQAALSAGVYNIIGADNTGCSSTMTLSIAQPSAALTLTLAGITPATCGSSNGSATVTANGGTPAYTYSWIPAGGNSNIASGLTTGNYSVGVMDTKGCFAFTFVTVNSASGPTISVVSFSNVSCFGGSNGAATVTSSGGNGTYTWTPGNLSGASQTALTAGVYNVSTSDNGGCISSTTVAITQPTAALTATISSTNTNCGGATGSATVIANGGTPTYNYVWTPSGGSASTATSLSAGNYTVKVTDAKSCTVIATANIISTGGATISIATQSNVSCFGDNDGSASVIVSGGVPTYTWLPTGGNTSSANNLQAGTYTIFASVSGCITFTTVTITQPAQIVITVNTTSASCTAADGAATANATGGAGTYTYTWSNATNGSTLSNVLAGTYTVEVTDVNGCSNFAVANIGTNTGGFTVNAGTGTTIEFGQSTTLNGIVPIGASYTWTPAGTLSCYHCLTPIATPTQNIIYTLIGTDANGCVAKDTVIILVHIPCGELFVPTAFSPNNDGSNDELFAYGNCITEIEFAIFDRWGEKVFETNDKTIGWDGKYKGKEMNAGAFAYYVKATVNGTQIIKKGSIALVR